MAPITPAERTALCEWLATRCKPLATGVRFLHSKWLDEANQPALCTISKVALGVIYYRIGDSKRARDCFPVEETSRWVKEFLS